MNSPPKPAPSRLDAAPGKAVLVTAGLCLAFSLAVFFTRGASAFQATHTAPGVAVTSGYEEESWFALWRTVHGQPVYADETRLPYASAYFNWLFYATYGAVAGPFGDPDIAVAGRIFTALWALAGGTALWLLWRRVTGRGGLVATTVAALVVAGPLVGWWAHTVRPDVAALALETTALTLLLLRHRRAPLTTALLAAVLFYAAWAFKQTYVTGLAAALLFLAVRRQWRPVLLLLGTSLLLWTATFALQGPAYREAFRSTARVNVFFLALGLHNLGDMLLKTSPLWLLTAAAGSGRRQPAGETTDQLPRDAVLLGALGLLVTLPLGFVASCKLGAASYYFFTATIMLTLLAAGFLATRRTPVWTLPATFLLAASFHGLALFGLAGQVSLTAQTTRLTKLWTLWQAAPEPRFSHQTSFNLPWLSPASPPLVLAFNYPLNRQLGQPLEHDGVGGLIASGHFQSLLLPTDTGDRYDGASLEAYTRGVTIGDLTVFHRRPRSAR